MSEIWKFFEQYKDIITNGSDLISFVLVTPQLIAFVPGISIVTPIMFLSAWLVAVLTGGTFVFLVIIRSSSVAVNIVLGVVVVVVIFRFIQNFWEITAEASYWMKKRAFVFGIVLFIVSRIFALAVAAHQVGSM
jgi:hypothetical protein